VRRHDDAILDAFIIPELLARTSEREPVAAGMPASLLTASSNAGCILLDIGPSLAKMGVAVNAESVSLLILHSSYACCRGFHRPAATQEAAHLSMLLLL
jgi:hypothetical protein